MEAWYLPITLLPSIGFFIMATTNVSNALSAEITRLIELDQSWNKSIVERKINQLGLLSLSLVSLYGSAILMAIAGLVGGLQVNLMIDYSMFVSIFICLGILGVVLALTLLMLYAVRAVRIKRDQFQQR